jgi:hypothetical protein
LVLNGLAQELAGAFQQPLGRRVHGLRLSHPGSIAAVGRLGRNRAIGEVGRLGDRTFRRSWMVRLGGR